MTRPLSNDLRERVVAATAAASTRAKIDPKNCNVLPLRSS